MKDTLDRIEEEYRALKRETERQRAVMSNALLRVAAMVAESREVDDAVSEAS